LIQPSFFASADFNLNAPLLGSAPEPGTLALFGIGLAALGFSRRRKRA